MLNVIIHHDDDDDDKNINNRAIYNFKSRTLRQSPTVNSNSNNEIQRCEKLGAGGGGGPIVTELPPLPQAFIPLKGKKLTRDGRINPM